MSTDIDGHVCCNMFSVCRKQMEVGRFHFPLISVFRIYIETAANIYYMLRCNDRREG
jgi:hypothetical protein